MRKDDDTEAAVATITSSRAESCTTISSAATQQNDTVTNSSSGSTSSTGARQLLGKWTVQVSEAINDNLILVRYGTITSIVLLSAYGFYKTPLFFRYKSVNDIPCMSFQKRHQLHGRIVHVKRNSEDSRGNLSFDKPFILYLYHLSPVQRLLNRSAFNFITRQKFLKNSWKQIEERDDLIKVELAGVKYPSAYYQALSYLEQDTSWLQSLTSIQLSVTIQLLSRRVLDVSTLAKHNEECKRENVLSTPVVDQSTNTLKKVSHKAALNSPISIDRMERDQTAICKVFYRPTEKRTYRSIFRKDMAISLVQHGRAEVLSSGLYVDIANKRTLDGSEKLVDITSDVSYMETLMKAEHIAIQEKKGLWANEAIRKEKEKFIDEVLTEAKASLWKRLLNWIMDRRR